MEEGLKTTGEPQDKSGVKSGMEPDMAEAPRTLRELIVREFPHEEVDIRTYSPLALAFLGDAVYSLVIRTALVSKGNRQAEKYHNDTTYYVRAGQQAAIGKAVYDLMTAEEQKVYRRGRNSNPYHHAKGSSLEEYLQATALETLCGYLYLKDEMPRLLELLREGVLRTDRKGKLGARRPEEDPEQDTDIEMI